MYSLAVMFFEMAVGVRPDMPITRETFFPLEATVDVATADFVKSLLKARPQERPTATECVARVKVLQSQPLLAPIAANPSLPAS